MKLPFARLDQTAARRSKMSKRSLPALPLTKIGSYLTDATGGRFTIVDNDLNVLFNLAYHENPSSAGS
jgi:hypothetical protein